MKEGHRLLPNEDKIKKNLMIAGVIMGGTLEVVLI